MYTVQRTTTQLDTHTLMSCSLYNQAIQQVYLWLGRVSLYASLWASAEVSQLAEGVLHPVSRYSHLKAICAEDV